MQFEDCGSNSTYPIVRKQEHKEIAPPARRQWQYSNPGRGRVSRRLQSKTKTLASCERVRVPFIKFACPPFPPRSVSLCAMPGRVSGPRPSRLRPPATRCPCPRCANSMFPLANWRAVSLPERAGLRGLALDSRPRTDSRPAPSRPSRTRLTSRKACGPASRTGLPCVRAFVCLSAVRGGGAEACRTLLLMACTWRDPGDVF